MQQQDSETAKAQEQTQEQAPISSAHVEQLESAMSKLEIERVRARTAEEIEANILALPPQEFRANGFIYVYDFDKCTIEQVMLAESVFNFHAQQMNKPARELRQWEYAGQMDFLAVAFSYLILQKTEAGDVLKFDRKATRDKAFEFIKSLPAGEYARLKRCKDHFFAKAGIVDIDSIRPLMPLLEALQNGSQSTPTPQEKEPNGSEMSLSKTPDYMSEAS